MPVASWHRQYQLKMFMISNEVRNVQMSKLKNGPLKAAHRATSQPMEKQTWSFHGEWDCNRWRWHQTKSLFAVLRCNKLVGSAWRNVPLRPAPADRPRVFSASPVGKIREEHVILVYYYILLYFTILYYITEYYIIFMKNIVWYGMILF